MMTDNPAAARRDEGHFPTAQLAIRQTMEVKYSGFLMLVPPLAPRYLLVPDAMRQQLRVFDLLQPSGPGVELIHLNDTVWSAALSSGGDSIFLGCQNGDLKVYETGPLLTVAAALLASGEAEADHQIVPRAWTPRLKGRMSPACGAAFSQDAARLFVLFKDGENGITVHDTEHPNLPVLRMLSFNAYGFQSNYMLACAGSLLAAAAGGGEGATQPKSVEEVNLRRQVQLWHLEANGETELWTVNNPDLADAVAVRPDGMIAVGLRSGVVRLLLRNHTGGYEQDVVAELEPPDKAKGSPMVGTLCFSLDGSKLVVGRSYSDDFTVYDVASAAVIHRFVHPKSRGFSAAFFPASDVLVTGTVAVAQQCMFHKLVPPAPRLELTMKTSTNIASASVASGGKYGSIVAMAAGSQVEVVSEAGEVLLKKDLGEELVTSMGGFRPAVVLQPGGKFVTCSHRRSAVVLSVVDGSECLRTAINSAYGIYWSSDGGMLALATGMGVRLFSTQLDFAEIQHLENGENTYGCAFDSTGARLVTGTNGGSLTIWEVATWTPTRTFDIGVAIVAACFSQCGDRVAFCTMESLEVGVLSLEAKSDSEPVIVSSHVNAWGGMQFSPDDNFLLCCPATYHMVDQHRMRVIDLATHSDADWGELLRTMALPVTGGLLHGRTLGWVKLSQTPSPAAETTDTVEDTSWALYGAVGKRLVAVDIQEARYAVQDNAWTTEKLTFCSEHQQDWLGQLAKSAPHCANIRDVDTGETVLHCLARMQQMESLKTWLGVCQHVPPVADGKGKTSMEVAIQLNQIDAAQALWQKLPLSITSIDASLVLQELWLLSKTYPHLVRPFLLDIDPSLARTLATFRTELMQAAEVCGLQTAARHDGSADGAAIIEKESVANTIPAIWSAKCSDSPKQLVAWRVVLLPNLLGDADSSPFHNIVAHCDASVFDSKLLQLIVQYKWEKNVRSMRIRSVALYLFAFVVGAIAMILSVQGTSSTADVLQGLVVVIEVSSLGVEAFQLTREGCATYFTGPWNLLDIMSSGSLLVGSFCHFAGLVDWLRTAGAVGVALKCFGMVDYLRSFSATGSLVRMVSVIMTDIVPFMTILLFALLGSTMFFTINLSSSHAELDLFWTLATVYHMTLGIGQGIDISTASVTTVAVMTLLMSFVIVVLLNLLIAIMGDSYEKVKESERVEAVRERARIIVEAEKWSPKSHQYPRFMHFVEAVDSTGQSPEIRWQGVTRRVIARTDRLEHKLDGELAQIKSEMNRKFELLDNKLDMLLNGRK